MVHSSDIGVPDYAQKLIPVHLTRAKIEASPDIAKDEPVTMQHQGQLYSFYGADPYSELDLYSSNMTGGSEVISGLGVSAADVERGITAGTTHYGSETGDPHLRSMKSVRGYHIHASDGSIGHIGDFLVDDESWEIRYLIVDTRNWWPGTQVLSPIAVKSIDISENEVRLTVRRDQVKSSPAWRPAKTIDRLYERQLHRHYDWPGYGS